MDLRRGYRGQEKNSPPFIHELIRAAMAITVITFFNGVALLPCRVYRSSEKYGASEVKRPQEKRPACTLALRSI